MAEDAPSTFTARSCERRFTITQRWIRARLDRIVEHPIAPMPFVAGKRPCSLRISRSRQLRLRPIQSGTAGQRTITFRRTRSGSSVIRKTGSGENALFLYHVERDGRVWRLSQHLDVWSGRLCLRLSHLTRADYYHMEVVLISWDLPAGKLRLKARATPEDKDEKKVIRGRSATYDLRKHIVTAE